MTFFFFSFLPDKVEKRQRFKANVRIELGLWSLPCFILTFFRQQALTKKKKKTSYNQLALNRLLQQK